MLSVPGMSISRFPPSVLGFCVQPLFRVEKKPRSICKDIPQCKLQKHSTQNTHKQKETNPLLLSTVCSIIAAGLLINPISTSAKGILSTNTIFRRYLVTDADTILRYALPLPSERFGSTDPIPIRQVQEQLERLGVDLRARGAAGIIAGKRDLAKLRNMLTAGRLDILLDVPAKKRQQAAEILSKMETNINDIESELGVVPADMNVSFLPPEINKIQEVVQDVFTRRNSLSKNTNFDGALIDTLRRDALDRVAEIEELAVVDTSFPYRIPRRFNNYPRLTGRATVEIKIQKNKKDQYWMGENLKPLGREVTLTAILDGYSAPLTAGNFVEIVKKGYYNGTRVLSSQKDFYVQLGEREDDDIEGFKDPKSGKRRQIPLEILVDGEPTPNYGATLDELGIGDLQPMLPISGYGAIAMVHSVEDPNDASSQFYFFFLDPNSYQARSFGGSILTGSLSTFGYVDEGKSFLPQMQAGDKIVSVKLASGEENFQMYGES